MPQAIYAVVPAAGVGRRMQSDTPKQYLILNDKPVIEHTVTRLASISRIVNIVVVVAEHDSVWPQLEISKHSKLLTAPGGDERCHSVLNGLKILDSASQDSWVLVHDAARPCVRPSDVQNMIDKLQTHDVGGILASPVGDTLKKSSDNQIIEKTVDRDGMWRAFTPQMFRLGVLRRALEHALEENQLVTDEAQAIESQGLKPVLVEGSADNIKITQPADLSLAALYLQQQGF
ncbi:MAG: 2-C-methyl-D-erythritol 4-phosphate cytidylyltransferase [Pseudomonadota bacterium]